MDLILIIGVPGSGKTTLAKKIRQERMEEYKIFEADMFFERNGLYNWNPRLLGAAHKWCYDQVENALKQGESVIVSNTSLIPKDRKPYLKLAKKYGANIEVFTCKGNFQNLHNVPDETIERMRQKFVPYSKNEENF